MEKVKRHKNRPFPMFLGCFPMNEELDRGIQPVCAECPKPCKVKSAPNSYFHCFDRVKSVK